ncbi:MAG: hypothetical protein RJB39_129 [Candidatus Parcubacteria bacterium]|jgi:glycosyltransferase involved in cell wall biosynthesis
MKVLFITRDLIQNAGWGRTGYETIVAIQKDKNISVGAAIERSGGKEGIVDEVISLIPSKSIWAICRNIIKVWKVRDSYDIFHAIDLWPYGLYAFVAARFGKRKKCIINGIATYSIAPLDKKIFGFIPRYVYRHTDAIPCISEYTKKEIDKRLPGANTSLVLQGFTKMEHQRVSDTYLAEKGIKDTDYPLLITVGEAKPRKGQLYTAKAVALLKEKYPNIKYLIVCNKFAKGYMTEIEHINAKLGGQVIQLINDAKTDGHLEMLYKRSDMFALNSVNSKEGHFEGFGLVILEANQFGTPALGSFNCGIESAIQDGVSGYLCRQEDEKDIARNIEKILEMKRGNPEYWKEKTIAFCNTFSWDKAAEQYIRLYK